MNAAFLLLGAMAVSFGIMVPAAHAQAPAPPPPPPDGPRYIVTYLEVMPTSRANAATLVRQFRDATRKEAGNLRAEALQRIGHLHQFVLLEAWKDQAAAETHAKAASTAQFRDKIKARTAICNRSKYRRRETCSLQNGLDQICRRRLAIRSGNADGVQLPRGVSVKGGSERSQRFSFIGDLNPCCRRIVVSGNRRNDCGSATRNRVRHKAIAVGFEPSNGDEDETGSNLARVQRDSRNRGVEIATGVYDAAPVQHRT